jgi:hypothetical protein
LQKAVKKAVIFILTIGIFSCNKGKHGDVLTNKNLDNYELLETLYYQCDTIIRTGDTLKIVNSKLDTTIIETGIFTFLQYDYPLTTPHKLINLSKTAVQFDNFGQKERLTNFIKT